MEHREGALRARAVALVAVTTLLATAVSAFPAGDARAQEGPVTDCDVAIEMSDGVTLRANASRPAAEGWYPTILEITPYNKEPTAYRGNCSTVKPDLVDAGYATMIVDDRGTGASEGRWGRYDPRSQQDYAEILDWIQRQQWSDGSVGATGTSNSAGTAMLTAKMDAKRVAAGKPRAVEAVWVGLIQGDVYRDYTHLGGFVNLSFTVPWLGLVAAVSAPPPTTTGSDPDALQAWLDHIANLKDIHVPLTAGAMSGGDPAYDSEFYRVRSPLTDADLIDVPVAWTGGWFDIMQRGEVAFWHALENAPVKKMWMMPVYHVGGDNTWAEQDIGSASDVRLAWWDRWLKGADNDVEQLPSVNLWQMGADRWWHGDDWPEPAYTPYYLVDGASGSANSLNDGVLSTSPPTDPGADLLPFTTAAGACTRSLVQWSGGLIGGLAEPDCATDNRADEVHALTYTTEPLQDDVEITGMITAELWARVSAPDTAFVVRLLDVAPDGASTQVAGGWLIARHRAVDPDRSLRLVEDDGSPGRIIRPFHPFTREAEALLEINQPTRFLIEVYPTSTVFQEGHRIRVAITTSDHPSLGVPQPWLQDMLGGEISLLRGPQYPSNVLLPMIEDDSGDGDAAIAVSTGIGASASANATAELR